LAVYPVKQGLRDDKKTDSDAFLGQFYAK